MSFKNFSTPHCHIQSLDSASTPKAFAKREVELGTGTITVTDHGTLQACRTVYDLCQEKDFKGKISPILGLEGYFRDDNCHILRQYGIQKTLTKGGKPSDAPDAVLTFAEYNKYFHLTFHALDQEGFETLVRLLSLADSKAERHGSERKQLFDWRDLEEIGSKNITVTSGCLIGMLQRHLMSKSGPRPDIAEAYFTKLKSIVKPGNFYVEVFPHVCDRNWDSSVIITLEDENGVTREERFPTWKTVKTNEGQVKVEDLAAQCSRSVKAIEKHGKLNEIMNQRVWQPFEGTPRIVDAFKREGYIINDCSPYAPEGDLQYGGNKLALEMAQKYDVPVIISDDSHFTHPEEKVVQDIRLQQTGSWRFATSYHRLSSAEAWDYFKNRLGTSERDFEAWIENNQAWAARFKGFKLKNEVSLPTKFYPKDTLGHTISLIKKHGRFDQSKHEYVARLRGEIEMLHKNGTVDLLPYFFIDEDVCSFYESIEQLTGPGRGSAAGLLLSYLQGITHVDPIRYGLSRDRFITPDRIVSGKPPDIDQDLPVIDPLTNPVNGFLKRKFGDHFSQISVDTTLKLKSAVKDVARVLHSHIPPDIDQLCKKFAMPPQGIQDYEFVFGYKANGEQVMGSLTYDKALQEYVRRFPADWNIVQKCLGLTRQKGRHACAFVISNRPIHEFIPTTSVSDVRVTQYTFPSVEASGGVKMDFLVINSLNDIADCIKMVQQRVAPELAAKRRAIYDEVRAGAEYVPEKASVRIAGRRVPFIRLVPFKGELCDIWDLPEDQDVFADVCEGRTESVFQFGTHSAIQWLREFNYHKGRGDDGSVHKALDSIEALAAFTALDRPGPLDVNVESPDGGEHNMLVEYARRARGEAPAKTLEVFNELFPETYGIMVYQEQLQKAYQVLTGCSGPEAEEFRSNVAKKKQDKIIKAEPFFIEHASKALGEQVAKETFEFFKSWGQYGFNKSVDEETILTTCDGDSKKIKDFVHGDKIWCVDERGVSTETEVVAVHDHGVLEGYEIEFDDGHKLTCTTNHKFLTDLGQVPLHAIVSQNLSVLCDPDIRSRYVLRNSSSETRAGRAQEGMLHLRSGQGREYPPAHAQAQHQARTEGGSKYSRQEDVSPKGHTASASCETSRLAVGAPRGVRCDYPEGYPFATTQGIESREVASVQRNCPLGGGADQVWGRAEAGGLRISGPQSLDRGGRMLPLLRALSGEAPSSHYPKARRNAERRGQAAGGDAIAPSRRVFHVLDGQDEGRLAGVAYSNAPLASTGGLVRRHVVRVRPVGPRRMCDLEVSHPKHNFLLPNGIVTSNSHAVCYVVIGYACAFLKHHYPLEWWCAVLRNADKDDINNKFWRHAGHLIDLPDVNLSSDRFEIHDGRIRAPLNLLHGIGDVIHGRLSELRPFKDISDYVHKEEGWKLAHSTSAMKDVALKKVTKKQAKEGLKVGDTVSVLKTKKGRSALGRGITYKMIVAGAMDSLFPKKDGQGNQITVLDRLMLYEAALATALGKKKPQPVLAAYVEINSLSRYQLKKQILPAFSEPLLPLILDQGLKNVRQLENGATTFEVPIVKDGEVEMKPYRFGNLKTMERIEQLSPFPDFTVNTAVPAFVVDVRPFSYAGGQKEAIEFVLDIDGQKSPYVMWGRKGKLPLEVKKTNWVGSIVVAVLAKFADDRPFAVDSLTCIQPPPDEVKESEEEDDS